MNKVSNKTLQESLAFLGNGYAVMIDAKNLREASSSAPSSSFPQTSGECCMVVAIVLRIPAAAEFCSKICILFGSGGD